VFAIVQEQSLKHRDSIPLPRLPPTMVRWRDAFARVLGMMDLRNITPDVSEPRRSFDEESLGRLSESLQKFGQLMPIRVR
jgi:hypothetical protein